MKTSTNQSATHTSTELYKLLIEVRNWIDYPNSDPAALWYRRRKAQESAVELTKTTKSSIFKAPTYWAFSSLFTWGTTTPDENKMPSTLKDLGVMIAKSLQAEGHNDEDVAQTAWMLAVSAVGTPVTAVSTISISV